MSAQTAAVCGEWNDWSADAAVMRRDAEGGFSLTVDLEAGRTYRFRYLLDGERWDNDWAADAYVPNSFGGDDSVIDLTALAEAVPPTAAKEEAAKQTAAKQTAAKQTAAKQTAAKQTAAKQTAAKQTAAKQTAAKQTAAKQTAAKQTAAKETAAKQTAAKQTAAKETAAKQTAAKQTAAKETAVKETAQATRKVAVPATKPAKKTTN